MRSVSIASDGSALVAGNHKVRRIRAMTSVRDSVLNDLRSRAANSRELSMFGRFNPV